MAGFIDIVVDAESFLSWDVQWQIPRPTPRSPRFTSFLDLVGVGEQYHQAAFEEFLLALHAAYCGPQVAGERPPAQLEDATSGSQEERNEKSR